MLSGMGIAQATVFLAVAVGVAQFLGVFRPGRDAALLLLVGACFLIPTLVVGRFMLNEFTLGEIILKGTAGITFAVPLGIGVGFVASALGALLSSGWCNRRQP